MRERGDLEKAFEGSEKLGTEELKKYIDQNLPERLEEKKKMWQEEVGKSRTPRGEELTAAEKRSMERSLYLKELSDYSIKHEGGIKGTLRGFFTGKEKVRILKDGKPVEKEGKPLEFKVNWAWKHPEKDMIEFLKSEIENKIKENLKKEWEERAKREAETRTETPIKEQAELGKKPLNQAEFFASYLRASGLDEEDITPAKLEELHRRWKAYKKEMGIKKPKGGKSKTEKEGVKREEMAKAVTQEKKEPPKEKPKEETVKKEGPEKKERKAIDFKKMEAEGVFEKIKEMNIEKNAKDIIGIIREYGPGISLPVYIEKLLKQYDQQRPEQYKLEKAKKSPKVIKEWLTTFLTDIKYSKRVEKLRKTKLGVEKKEEAREGVGEEPKEEKIEKTKQVFPVESTVRPEKEILSSDEEDGEELERRPKKKKESAGDKKRLAWLEHAKKLRENGNLKLKVIPELRKFFSKRGYTEEQIREMGKNPATAWDKALEIYDRE